MRLQAAIRLLALSFVLAALGASPAQADFDYSSPQGVGTFLNLEQGSCPTTTFCAVGNSGGDVFTTANPTGGSAAWTGKNVGIASAISGISCPDTTLCVGVDTAGDVITSTNPTAVSSATWTVTTVDAGFQVRGVSCPTTTLCVAVDESGRVITSTNPTGGAAAWTKFSVGASGGFYQVDCPTTTLCVAVDSFGEVATSTNPTGGFGFWAVATIDGTNPLFSVDCNASLCLAGDQHGNVVASNNPAGGSPAWHLTDLDTSTTTNSLFGVSCPSSTLCVAADNDGKIWTSTAPLASPAVWTGTQTGASLFTGLMCPSTALCVAPTNDGSVVVATPAKPAVLTLAADDVTASSATVHGSVNPKGFNVTACKFDIGNAAGSYQSSVDCAQTVGGGSGAVPVSANLGGLAPSTTVHFRARATTASGTSVGIDQSFTTPAFVAEPGNVATWHLDSQSAGTTPDSSGHGLDGQQVSATPAAGRFNNAFQLSNTGDGFVVPNSFSLEGRIGLTTMAWVKRSGTPGNFRTILAKGGLGCSGSAYALDTASNGGLRFYVAFNSGIAQTPAVAPSAVWDGQWHAIGGTWDATTGSVSLWLDGRKVSTTQSPGGDPAYDSYPEKQLGVGRFPDSSCSLGGFQYTGQLDEVRVYGRSLQPYEIAYLQRQEPTTPRTLPAPIPPVFTDFTSLVGGVAHGTLAGRSVTVSGSTIQGTGAGSTMDGSSTQFAGKAWDPSLSHSDALDLVSPSGGATYTLHFGEPVTDPVFHLGAVNAQISFPAGTQVTRVSGGATFTVSGANVNGSGGANGTVRVTGTFTTLTLSTAVSTGFFLEVGTAVGAHDTPLLVRWPLDIIDDGRSPDFSGHELDGTAASAAIVSGRFGGAYDLNGTSQGFDFTDPTSTGLLEPPGSFTVAGWVRGGPAPRAPGGNTFILAKGGGCRDPSYSLGTGDNGGLEFGVQFDSGPPGAFDVVRSTPITPESVWDGTWHSVVGVYDQSTGGGARTVSLWLDGVHVGGATVPAGYGNVDFASDHVADRQLTVGYTPMSGTFGSGCTERRFHGAIDELRMYEI
ncbi:MAG: hypothetical protein QOK35_3752, partial [Pseudonocardiales bacterium]|nr:hypothetical protein [Pseudonocardiales bacterium]